MQSNTYFRLWQAILDMISMCFDMFGQVVPGDINEITNDPDVVHCEYIQTLGHDRCNTECHLYVCAKKQKMVFLSFY